LKKKEFELASITKKYEFEVPKYLQQLKDDLKKDTFKVDPNLFSPPKQDEMMRQLTAKWQGKVAAALNTKRNGMETIDSFIEEKRRNLATILAERQRILQEGKENLINSTEVPMDMLPQVNKVEELTKMKIAKMSEVPPPKVSDKPSNLKVPKINSRFSKSTTNSFR